MICEKCGRTMSRTRVRHINICQKITTHVFCSKECKDSWVFEIQKGKIKIE
ncbi:MAG: hypothetical protein ACFFAT_02885 [Promethearchaeota archaeon]